MTYSGGWHPHIESALCLDVRAMLRKSAMHPGFTTAGAWTWTRDGEAIGSAGYRATLGDASGTLTLDYTTETRDGERKAITCTLELESLPCNYGGRRWFARCPYTHRRAWKLYKFHTVDLFCARDAIRPRPTYACQRVGGADRINAQRWALRRKLGDRDSDLTCDPVKPRWMRWRTFQRYIDRDAELDARSMPYFAALLGRLGVPGLG